MVPTIADFISWEAFGRLLLTGYQKLALPNSENAAILLDLVIFHATVDPLIFAIRTSILIAFICWFQSMATGTHSWVGGCFVLAPLVSTLFWPDP